MTKDEKLFVFATAQLVGTIIGVGVFGVPYALSKIGVGLGLVYFVVLGGIQLLQHLFYAEAAIACPDKLRLAGLVERYLGKRAKHLAAVSTTLGYWAALLAYMIVGGTFLHVLFSPFLGGSEFVYQLAWSLIAAAVVFFGLDFVARVGFVATIGLVATMLAIIGIGIPHAHVANFVPVGARDFALPYGVILFSLSGLPAILEMEDILKGKHARYRVSVVAGTLIAAALTAAFGYVIWGVTGAATTQDGVIALRAVLGNGVTTLTAVFGFLAVSTSFFTTGINLQNTIRYDYKVPKTIAWLAAGLPPFIVFLWGAKDFVDIIGFSGAVFGGITAILVAMLYVAVTKKKLTKDNPLGVPVAAAYLSMAVLASGALYEIATSAQKLMK